MYLVKVSSLYEFVSNKDRFTSRALSLLRLFSRTNVIYRPYVIPLYTSIDIISLTQLVNAPYYKYFNLLPFLFCLLFLLIN